MATTRNHMRVLEAAFPAMSPAQRAVAWERMRAAETKWGRLLYPNENVPETDDISPETRVARWLSTRKTQERLLIVLYRAALSVANGTTCMSDVMDYAFAREIDFIVHPVGQTSFTEWMMELRIAAKVEKGVYASGSLCDWWVSEMAPGNRKSTTYRACLEGAEQLRRKGQCSRS